MYTRAALSLVVTVFLGLAAVFCSPAPPVQGGEAFQEYLDHLLRQSDGDLWGLLNEHALHNPIPVPAIPANHPYQAPIATSDHAYQAPVAVANHPYQVPDAFVDRSYQTTPASVEHLAYQVPAAFAHQPNRAPETFAGQRYQSPAFTGHPYPAADVFTGHPRQALGEFAGQHYQTSARRLYQADARLASLAEVPLHRGPAPLPFSVAPPSYFVNPRQDSSSVHRGISTGSISVSSGTQNSHLTHGIPPSPQPPIFEGVPVGTLHGPPPNSFDTPANPIRPRPPIHSQPRPTVQSVPEASHGAAPEVDDPHELDNSDDPNDSDFSPEHDGGSSDSKEEADARELSASKRLKRPLYKTVFQPDSDVDDLITDLRARMVISGINTADDARGFERVQIPSGYLGDLELVTINTFWHRAAAKEMLVQSHPEPKRLFFTYNPKPRFLAHLDGLGFVGVWEMRPPMQRSLSTLRLYGFYPFTRKEYIQLKHEPEALGDYWITVRHGYSQQISGLSLTIAKMSEQEDQKVSDLLQSGESHVNFAMTRNIQLSSRRLSVRSQIRSVYVLQESNEVSLLLQRWKSHLGLSQASFKRIVLNPEQQRVFIEKIPQVFRSARQVKLFKIDLGKPIMLCFHQSLLWLPRHGRSIVTVWRFGPIYEAGGGQMLRRLYANGIFYLSPASWQKLDAKAIPGLVDTYFQYDRAMPFEINSSQQGQLD